MRVVRVQDIILDESHYHFDGEDSIGTILYTEIHEPTPRNLNFVNLKSAKPIYYNMVYPIPNELVFIILAPSSRHNDLGDEREYYFPPIAVHKAPTSNALPNTVNKKGEYYKGSYFKENISVRPLRPYEGDVILEGRFGNSIRLGSTIDNKLTLFPNYWSNKGTKGNPITIIRNGQNPGTIDPEGTKPKIPYTHILEDIQNDDASVALCSMQQISNFTPASMHMDSYGYKKNKETKNREEINFTAANMTSETTEDISPQTPKILPRQLDRMIIENKIPNTKENTADFDIAPTENKVIFPEDSTPLTVISGSTFSDSDIDQVLGVPSSAPIPAVQDQTFFNNLDGMGTGGYGGF